MKLERENWERPTGIRNGKTENVNCWETKKGEEYKIMGKYKILKYEMPKSENSLCAIHLSS